MMFFLAALPTSTEPSSRKDTTEACVDSPHSLGITTGRPYLLKPFDMVEAVNLIEKLGR